MMSRGGEPSRRMGYVGVVWVSPVSTSSSASQRTLIICPICSSGALGYSSSRQARTICWPERPKPTTTAASPISACAFLAGLGALSGDNPSGSMPIVDLAGLNSRSITGILDWCEHQSTPGGRPLLMFSHGEITHPISARVRGLTRDQIVRLRALGGVVGLTPSRSSYQTPDELKAVIEEIASIPFEGRSGHEGIAIGTDFLACEQTLPGLADVTQIKTWLGRTLDGDAAPLLLAGNASRLLVRAAGVPPGAGPPR